MRFHSVLEVMENGTLAQGALHAAEGVLGAGERGIDPPPFFGRKILTVGVQQVAAIKARRHLALSKRKPL